MGFCDVDPNVVAMGEQSNDRSVRSCKPAVAVGGRWTCRWFALRGGGVL